MLIEVRTDGNINGSERFSDHVKAVLRTALERYGDRIRRVDVHLSDAVSNKTSHDDKCCMIEARYDGFEPIVVTLKGTRPARRGSLSTNAPTLLVAGWKPLSKMSIVPATLLAA